MKRKQNKPNKLAEFLIKISFRREDISYRLGDLEEAYQYMVEKDGKISANKWYWKQVISSLPHLFNISIFWGIIMFKNYFKIAIRNIIKNKVYSFINIFGLAVGLAVAILIFRWTEDEFSTNQFHEKINNIHRVAAGYQNKDPFNGAPPMVGPSLLSDYEEVKNVARYRRGAQGVYFSSGDLTFKETWHGADFSFFDIFSFPLKDGVINKDSKDIYQAVISEKIKEKYFGKEDAIGRTLMLNNQYSFRIVAVMFDPPQNSTIRPQIVVPIDFQAEFFNNPNLTKTWYNCSFSTFALLNDNINKKDFANKIKDQIKNYQENSEYNLHLISYADEYLIRYGSIDKIRLFQIIGILILIVACINFMNLSTARSAKRAKEVGLRKVVGAVRKQLVYQFFGESIIITFISFLFAIVIIILTIPFFNELADKSFLLNDFFDSKIIASVFLITFITSIIAGSYPALYLSSFLPGKVLKGELSNSSKNKTFRTALVITQFAITIVLIISSTTIYRQIDFMKSKELGFEKDQILYFKLNGSVKQNVKALKNEILTNSSVQNVTASTHLPTGIYWNTRGFDWEGRDSEFNPLVTLTHVDKDFLNTMGINLIEGKFYEDKSSDTNYVVINQTFAKMINWDSYENRPVTFWNNTMKIKGVVSDFHFKPLFKEIEPLIILSNPEADAFNYMMIKIASTDIEKTIQHIEAKVLQFSPKFPFEYNFLDEQFDNLYNRQSNYKNLIHTFTLLAILISCLGLFGLAAFMAEQRTKEIGVRKVMGADIKSIMLLLSQEFVKWIVIANIIAIPIGYYLTNEWLNDFAYRISLGFETFIFSTFLALAVALMTVSIQTYKAALSNPINSLRSE